MSTKNDIISNPSHYCFSEYEPRKVIRSWGLNFNLGNTVKYVARAGRKDDILQDLKKARQYLDFEIEAIEEERKDVTEKRDYIHRWRGYRWLRNIHRR